MTPVTINTDSGEFVEIAPRSDGDIELTMRWGRQTPSVILSVNDARYIIAALKFAFPALCETAQ